MPVLNGAKTQEEIVGQIWLVKKASTTKIRIINWIEINNDVGKELTRVKLTFFDVLFFFSLI